MSPPPGVPARRRRRLAVALVAVLALVVGVWLLRAFAAPKDVRWATVRRGDLVLSVEVTGTLRATETSLIGPPQLREYWDFKIARMAPEGQEVRAGTPVLAFDASDLRVRLEQQQAESDQARKQIEKTEKTLEVSHRRDELRLAEAEARLRKAELAASAPAELSKSKDLALARLDLELAQREVGYLRERLEAARRSAEAQLAALRNQRDRADQRTREIQEAIERMVREAPRDGTVIYVTDWREQKKKVGDSVWRGESVIELPDLTAMEAEGAVDEADAGRLAEGQRVTLRLDAHPDLEFAGVVSSIWKTVQRQSWRSPLRVVQLSVELDRTDRQRMRPGMRFRGRVETERIAQTLGIPLEAVHPGGDGPVVYRRRLIGYERVRIELGRRNETDVEVRGGLQAGDAVALVDLGRAERSAI